MPKCDNVAEIEIFNDYSRQQICVARKSGDTGEIVSRDWFSIVEAKKLLAEIKHAIYSLAE